MSLRIAGIGVASPEHKLPVDLAIEMAHRLCCETPKQKRLAEAAYRRSGVAERQTCVPGTDAFRWEETSHGPTLGERMAMYEEHAGPLATESAAAALADAGIDPSAVTHLVTVSCTGFEAPGVDIVIISSLGLQPTVQRVNVGFMGCHGAINGLRVAHGLSAADSDAVVLLVSTELCGLHYAYGWDPERLVGNALFGDASAAIVGVSQAESLESDRCDWQLADTGSCLLPSSTDLMSWRMRDHGFEMTLSSKLPALIEQHLPGWLPGWLAERGVALEEIGCWAVHPGGPKVLTAVENALGLDESATVESRNVLRDHGNVSSATVLFLIERLRDARAAGPCVTLGFGPGIYAEVALWR
ncbi:MAG: type III polyketide synthase [Planctomycetota bacterium]